jgi:hypothetical protein
MAIAGQTKTLLSHFGLTCRRPGFAIDEDMAHFSFIFVCGKKQILTNVPKLRLPAKTHKKSDALKFSASLSVPQSLP